MNGIGILITGNCYFGGYNSSATGNYGPVAGLFFSEIFTEVANTWVGSLILVIRTN